MKKTLGIFVLAGIMAMPNLAAASSRNNHSNNKSKVIEVKSNYSHNKPSKTVYKQSDLKSSAVYAVLSGVTYAVIDNIFYRQNGDNYTYVPKPPQGNYTVVTRPTASPSKKGYRIGEVISALPKKHQSVVVGGKQYYRSNNDWFAARKGTKRFVVVKSPLS